MRKLVVVLLVLLLFGCTEQLSYDKPNIIIIGLDAARPDHVSPETTPNLVNFSNNAYVFSNSVTQAPWTLPSFMSLFTSLYPSQHGLTNKYELPHGDEELVEVNLSEDISTLAEVLKANGYSTAAFTGDSGVLGYYGFNRGFDVYVDNITFGGFTNSVPLAVEWLENVKEPFFLFLHGYEAHGKFEHEAYGVSSTQWMFYRNLSVRKKQFELTEGEVSNWNAWYDEKLTMMDEALEPILSNERENTIYVLLSDHGEGFYEHGTFDHGLSLYDEIIKTILIIKLPDQNGSVIADQVRLIDVVPTLLDLANIDGMQEQQMGRSLMPLLLGEHMKLDAFSETDYLYNFFIRGIRTHDGWKLLYFPETESFELYDLKNDPKETNNLADEHPAKVRSLRSKLFSYLN